MCLYSLDQDFLLRIFVIAENHIEWTILYLDVCFLPKAALNIF